MAREARPGLKAIAGSPDTGRDDAGAGSARSGMSTRFNDTGRRMDMNKVIAYDPFADVGFDDLFRGFFKPVRVAGPAPLTIKMDVSENDKGYVVQAEIPGARKEDIQVTIEGNQVTIGAEVKREVEAREGDKPLRAERYFGSLYRSFALPVEVDETTSAAKFENGVLELTLAKQPALAGRKLTIQ
jgi:HSP20 family protein